MTKDQVQETISDIIVDIDCLRTRMVSVLDTLSNMPDATPPDFEAEVNRRMVAKMRSAADEMEGDSNVPHVVTVVPDEAKSNDPQGESGSDTGAPDEAKPDYPLGETVAEAQETLGRVEAEEYARAEPDFKRLHQYQRHATQMEAAQH